MAVTLSAEGIGVLIAGVQFGVEAWDERKRIGEGTHERANINVAKFATRVAAKKS
jgi:predicted thioesterase